MAEDHGSPYKAEYEFIDPQDGTWVGSPYKAESDSPEDQLFAVYANQLKDTEVESWFNVDGSARGNPGDAGIGGVLRDFRGKVLGSFSKFVGRADAITAEIFAIHQACVLCTESPGLRDKQITIISDSKGAVSWVNGAEFGSLELVNYIYEIREMVTNMGRTSVIHNPRASNCFADFLAKKGSNQEGDSFLWELFKKKLKDTEGFHVQLPDGPNVHEDWCDWIRPDRPDSEWTIEAADTAIKKFNELKGADLKLIDIKDSNLQMVSGLIHFLTLQCSDGDLTDFYEAKIYMPITGDCELDIFRPAKYWPWPRKDKNTNEEDDAEPEGSQVIGKKRKVEDTNEGGVGV